MWEQVDPDTAEESNQDVVVDHVTIPGEHNGIWRAESLGLYLARTHLLPWGADEPHDLLWLAASLQPIHEKLHEQQLAGRAKPSWLWHIRSGQPAEVLDEAKDVLGNTSRGEDHIQLLNTLRKELTRIEAPNFTAESDGPFYDTDHVSEYVTNDSPADTERALEGLVFGSKYQKHGDSAGECSICGRVFEGPEPSCKMYMPTSPEFPIYRPDMKGFVACNEHEITSLSEIPYITMDMEFAPFQVPDGLDFSDQRKKRARHLGPCGGFATEDLLIKCNLEWLSTGGAHSGVLTVRDSMIIDRMTVKE